jgi:hypothetical protein
MTTETASNPKWRRALWLALKIYAGLCTILVTTYLVFALWITSYFSKPSPVFREAEVMTSYGEYVAKESPKRARYFLNLATTFGQYSREASPIRVSDLFKYLGKPDLISGTEETGLLVYIYDHPGATNKWAVYASLKDGKLMQVGFNGVAANDHSEYRAYPTQ